MEQPGASLSLRRCSGPQSRLSGGDTQLWAWRRSWASGPRRPPRLLGCTGRCCSGRVSGNQRDRPLQTSAPLVLPSLGAQVSSFPSSQFRHFSITPFLLSRFFSHRLPSSSVWKQMSVHKSRILLRHQVLPAEVLLDPGRDSYLAVSPRACRQQPRVGGRSGSKAGIPRRKKALSIGPDVP